MCDSFPEEFDNCLNSLQTTITIDFNDMATGLTNSSLDAALAPYGIAVRTITTDGKQHPAMIFNSDVVSGGDFHIGSPNEACAGCTPETCRGLGTGGAPFQPGANCERLYQCLIASEDCNAADPDDNANGAVFLFESCTHFYWNSQTILNAPAGSYLKFYDVHGNQCPGVYVLPIPMHHVNARVDIGPITVFNDMSGLFTQPTDDYTKAHCNGYPVSRVAVHLAGSGCLDNIQIILPAVTNSICVDDCPGTCCNGIARSCAASPAECDGDFYPDDALCSTGSELNVCDTVCCVDNDRAETSTGVVVPLVDCPAPRVALRPTSLCGSPVTLGACCARNLGAGVCYDGVTSGWCTSQYGGEWFPRLYCGDPEVDQCRLGQCCEVAPNDAELSDRKRALEKRGCRKRAGVECPCEDVVCPAGFDTELPCSREGVCKKKSGWGWFTQFECRFGTQYGSACADSTECTYEGQQCECDECLCSDNNKGADASVCTAPTSAPTTAPTPAPTPACPPAENQCAPNQYRRDCQDGATQYVVFTPYQPDVNPLVCSPLAPCYESCCGTQCRISATYLPVEGGMLFRYFFQDCGAEYLSVPYCVNQDLSALKCKYIAPRGPLFELSSAGSALDKSESSSSSSSLSSIGDDASAYSSASETTVSDKCSLIVSCGNGIGVPIHSNYHGVEFFVPGSSSVTTATLSLVVGGECVTCGIEGPIAQCTTVNAFGGERGVARLAASTVAQHKCVEPPMPTHAMSEAQQRSATLAWADLADERMSALLDCVRKPFTDSAPVKVHMPSDGGCDYERCYTRIGSDRTRRTLASAAIDALLDGDRQLSVGHYSDASQAYCCAEFIVDRLADVWKCSAAQMAARCGTQVVHPVASPSRGRPTLQDIDVVRRIDADGRPLLAVLAFEQCRLNDLTVVDGDLNDGVFEVSATSHIDGDRLLDYTVLVRPVAFGARDDAALDVRFADVGVPSGSRVLVSVVGGDEPFTVCYTANSLTDATADCPSMATARLFRSVRATFGSNARDAAKRPINTLANVPHVASKQVATMVVYPPAGTRAAVAADIRLDFELAFRNEEASCVTRSNGVTKGSSGYAVLVSAPFRWPKENVPAVLEGDDGMCVGGDDAGQQCKEKQECPRGYCHLEKGPMQYHCVDTVRPGVDYDSTCAHQTQCYYGVCYGYKGSNRRGAYPQLRSWLECVGVGCYSAKSARSAWCLQSACLTDALDWAQHPDEEYAADDLYPLQQ